VVEVTMSTNIDAVEAILRSKYASGPGDSFPLEVKEFIRRFKRSNDLHEDKEKASNLMAEILTRTMASTYTFDEIWPFSEELVIAAGQVNN
jgi:hypothetical protein